MQITTAKTSKRIEGQPNRKRRGGIFHSSRRLTRRPIEDEPLSSPLASTASDHCFAEDLESLINAAARSSASRRFATAASSAASSAASLHAFSRLLIPGNGVALIRIFLRLSQECLCTSSCRTATCNSWSLSTVTAMSEIITLGLQIPTRISPGAPFEADVDTDAPCAPSLRTPASSNDQCDTARLVFA